MKSQKTILITLSMIVLVSIVTFLLIPKSCSYINFAWGVVKRDCDCFGYKIDTSCKTPDGGTCPDAGEESSCIGVVSKRKCFDYQGYKQGEYVWKQIPCR